MGDPLLIVGTGAMACLFGARLAPHAQVTLLGTWPDGLRALQQDGIRLDENGRTQPVRVRVTSRVADCRGASQALVLVKSWQTARAAQQLAECLAPQGVALTLQNGLGNLETLQAELGSERAALGVTTVGATLLGPGWARAGGNVSGTGVGQVIASLASIAHALLGAQRRTADQAEGGELMRAAAQETAAVAAARGLQLPYPDAAVRVEEVAQRTATNISSMLQDIRRGAPTEIDAINGAVVREGEHAEVPTPLNWSLWNLVRAKVNGARPTA
jgi:2-dehydropantoate 2-reductase